MGIRDVYLLPLMCVIFAVLLGAAIAQESLVEEDQYYWTELAKEELATAKKVQWNERTAKNVILFIGDGMDPNTITASRIYKGNEQTKLSFEEFPHIGLLKTYCVDKQVPDSAATASALFAGVKINFATMGVDSRVKLGDCEASLDERNRIKSIMQWAQDAGKSTGFVTNTRVTHATPGALFAHAADRKWECDGKMPEGSKCKDIARQMIEDLPGKNINVIMGGGRQCLQSNVTATESDPLDSWACVRKDKRNLIDTWVQDKRSRNLRYRVLNNTGDLMSFNTKYTDYVMGIFANSHMAYDYIRDGTSQGMPSLKEMTMKAIEVLQKNPAGYVLVVEGGLIDQAHHRGYAKRALNETLSMDEAIVEAVKLVQKKQRDGKNRFIYDDEINSDTLVVVTSDHAHSMSINGYPIRGNSILGLAQTSPIDNIPYTTLGYATADSNAFNYTLSENGTKVTRADPSGQDYNSFDYHQQAAITSDEAYHGGGDVAVYATGPMAHLFHNLHEQHYVAHVMAFAAKIGPYSTNGSNKTSTKINYNISLLCTVVCFIMAKLIS